MPMILLKFTESSKAAERDQFVRDIEQMDAVTFAPLFPDEADPELAAMFTAEASTEAVAAIVLAALEASDVVQYAEHEPKRKLVR